MNKIWIAVLLILCGTGAAKGQSGLPAHYHCVTSGVNNGLMHPSVALKLLFIYNQAEIAAMTAPVTGPVNISRIYFRTNNGGTANYTGLTIRMGHSTTSNAATSTTFATNFNVGAPVTVYSGNASFVMSGSNLGCATASTWFYLDLTTPFAYNFTNNLVVELSYSAQSGAIPSYYALNPGGGANPTAITAATAGAATGSVNSRPMFGISAGPVLDGESIQLDLIDTQAQGVKLQWEADGLNFTDAYFLISDEWGETISVPAGEPGLHTISLPHPGLRTAEVRAVDAHGVIHRSNPITWHQMPPVILSPNPVTDAFWVRAGAEIRKVCILNVAGQQVEEALEGEHELSLGRELPAGVYWVEVTLENGAVFRGKVVKVQGQ